MPQGTKVGLVQVVNRGDRAVTIVHCDIVVQGTNSRPAVCLPYGFISLAPRSSCLISSAFLVGGGPYSLTNVFWSPADRWQLRCYIQRETLFAKLRRTLLKLPVIRNHANHLDGDPVTSDWFSQ